MTEPERRPYKRVQKDCGTVSRTKQSFKDECDVNVVMRRFANNGVIPTLNKAQPRYGDFATVGSFLDAQVAVIKATDDFNALPSAVRSACQNDPAKFLEMCADPERQEELVQLGLKRGQVPPTMVRVIPEPEPPKPKEPAGEGEGETP